MKSLIVASLLVLSPTTGPSQTLVQQVQWGSAPYCGIGCQSYCAGGWNWRGKCKRWACQCNNSYRWR